MLLPSTFLKVAFMHPASSDVSTAERFSLGHSTPADVRSAAASTLIKIQAQCINEYVSERPNH
eukprot:351387-Lingulodinium_polyedra.AAC.1